MRTVVHLSDLHFGRTDPALLEPCVEAVWHINPDMVVVSGDFTQRAREWQFAQAREFLDKLPHPQLAVPGNHDVPLDNVFARFLRPLTNYKRYISEDLEPHYVDEELAFIGINTARSFTIQGGGIRRKQIEKARQRICELSSDVLKIVVTHHPFDLPAAIAEQHLVRGANYAIAELTRCGADIFLSGHLHLFHSALTTRRYQTATRSALIVQAGTGLSTRTRGEVNTFNVLRTTSNTMEVSTYAWLLEQGSFNVLNTEIYERYANGWRRPEQKSG